ncbi:hypothetical protein TL16_g06169 [Triparma laevis f. inornata]|uniref:Uncharacterized protein n=1 Tax=Triparma laevis f. inornata TaxID=1714386 RepID=A0A9W7APZ3_9STRA|nr:hypothetical protein TL16_g06169 [Triparma laevis f. inornata]
MTTVEHETTFDEDHVDPTSAAASMFAGLGLLSEAFLVLTLPVIGLLLNVPDLTTWVPISMIGGMITLGFAGLVYDNVNGRRFLSILVIAIMAASAITLLTSPFPIISVNAFAFSVGGEYAISSAFIGSAQIEENAARGFVMQSVGAFLAAAIMFISFLFNPNNKAAFISTVGTSACLVLLVFSLRVRNYTALHLKERHDADALLPPPLAQQQPQTINRTLTPPTPPTPSRWAKFTSSLNCVNENKSYNELEGAKLRGAKRR